MEKTIIETPKRSAQKRKCDEAIVQPDDTTPKIKKKKKQKKKNSSNGSSGSSSKESKPLNGLILAVSTLDQKDEKHSSLESSYQAVSALCVELGAKVRGTCS
jgi:hypothetical protein